MRGNVDTRLRRLAEGDADALVLAAAGLQRLGRGDEIGCVLDELVPAPGQGTLVLEARAGDERAAAAARAITDARDVGRAARRARARGAAGRELQHAARRARAGRGGDARSSLRTFVGPARRLGLAARRDAARARRPAEAGALAAERLLAAGGGELLARAEEVAAP